jgi:small-conductance mechanosensitive channel
MEAYLFRLEQYLADLLGGALLAQTVSKVLLISIAAVIFWFFWVLLRRLTTKARQKINDWRGTRIKGLKIQNQRIISERDAARLLQAAVNWTRWILNVVLILGFINITFYFFDWSRSLALTVIGGIGGSLRSMGAALVDYLPKLAVIIVVVFIARFLIHLLRLVFQGINKKRISFPGFYPEWSRTSFNLLRIVIIALSLVIIFPYLPGSSSPAFQGVSIFVGVLLSLGSTSAVANVVAGIVITFTRAFKVGDRVKISNTEGDVIERSAFVTRIRTPKNVEVSVPNASVLNNHIINYSAQADESGLTLHTTITIGYDVPWPQVHELLIAAALKTEDVMTEPKPFVLQTALNDFYVEYELNATTREPNKKSLIYSDLRAHILDAFQQASVEIMSPHYLARRDGSVPVIPQDT